MSYDVDLKDSLGVRQVPLHREGGTYAAFGTSDASLSITYNYSSMYSIIEVDPWEDRPGEPLRTDFSINWLHGRKAEETIPVLERVVSVLGTVRDTDYWKPTPGNAGYAASTLLAWATMHPDAEWEVS